MDNPKWHLTKQQIRDVIRRERGDNPDANPYAIYLAILQAQKRLEEESGQIFARSVATGELLSIGYFNGRITSVAGVSEVPAVFEEAFKESRKKPPEEGKVPC